MSQAIERNKGWSGVPLTINDTIVKLRICPDCNGRGYFLINPFRTGGPNGAGGIANMCQCTTCLQALGYFKVHGKLPDELAKLLEVAS